MKRERLKCDQFNEFGEAMELFELGFNELPKVD